MKTSTEIVSASRIVGEEKAVELIAKAGFDAWDFSMFSMAKYDWGKKTFDFNTGHVLSGNDYLAFARKLKKIGEDNGIHCNQSHAPFPSGSNEIFPYLMRAIECTAEAGGEICIIHPNNDKNAFCQLVHRQNHYQQLQYLQIQYWLTLHSLLYQ